MVELALDDSILSGLDEKDWWFEEEPPSAEEGEVFAGQGVCKWYVSFTLCTHLKSPEKVVLVIARAELMIGIGQ